MDINTGNCSIDLGAAHHQCSTARREALRTTGVSLAIGTVTPFGSVATVGTEQVGALDSMGDCGVDRTYRGARAIKNGTTVNQSVTMSFDPATLICLSCSTEHKIIESNRPAIIMCSDQNFLPVWPGTVRDTCISVVRIENTYLHEIVDLLEEIFVEKSFPEGSLILVGSVSYLHRVGISKYTTEWCQVAGRVDSRWPGVRLGPLVPIIRTDVPGGVTREILELTAWFSKTYEGISLGFKEAWSKLSQLAMHNSAGVIMQPHVESYTVSAPDRLHPNAAIVPWTFFTNSSRPSLLKGLDEGQYRELLDSIATILDRDFRIPAGVGAIPVNAIPSVGVKEPLTKLVLVGASNLKKIAAHLRSLGFEVLDLCLPGWMVTPATVAEVTDKMRAITLSQDIAFVFDVFGNSVVRYELYDGTTPLPVKMGGRYHLLGEIVNCSEQVFKKLFEIASPLFEAVPSQMRIILPPQPRYVFGGCCDDLSHGTNSRKTTYPAERVSSFLALRNQLKKLAADKLSHNFWVADSCCAVEKGAELNTEERVKALRGLLQGDGVHLSEQGYRNAAKNIGCILEAAWKGKQGKFVPASPNAALVSGPKNFHWRGFNSPVGSRREPASNHGGKAVRGRQHKHTPYTRGGKRGGGW